VFGGLVAAFCAAVLGVGSTNHALLTQRAFLVVKTTRTGLVVHARPGGPVVARLGPLTDFGTPRVLGVVASKGDWLGVSTEAVPNGQVGWVRARGRVTVGVVDRVLKVSLSARRLEVFDWGRRVRSFRIGVGTATSPTPLGRFAIAEKIPGERLGAVYGCCVLGLSARQPHPPAAWHPAEYLVAIHGGGGIGSAVSAGCIHLRDADLRYLMRRVPVGAPVFIQP
jgi:hypothetical protein